MSAAFFSGSTPEHIWMAAALKAMALLPLTGQHRIELAGPIQCMELIAAADMLAIYEDLREGRAAVRAVDHLLAQRWRTGRVMLCILDPLGGQQGFGAGAIAAALAGIDRNVCHFLLRARPGERTVRNSRYGLI